MAGQRYREIQERPKCYGIVDLRELSALCGFPEVRQSQEAHRQWIKAALTREMLIREDAGRKRLQSAVWVFLTASKVSLAAKRGIGQLDTLTDRMRYAKKVRLTTAI